jgi:hypothetical protein
MLHTSSMHIGDKQSQQRLARAVKTRRAELKLRQQDLTGRGGPSKASLYNIENAAAVDFADQTIADLERSLDWATGSVAAILRGEEPTALPAPEPETESGGIQVEYLGWRLTLHPRAGATREEISRARKAVLDAVIDRLEELDQETGV